MTYRPSALALFLAAALAIASLLRPSSAAVYVVGDTAGWIVTGNSSFYSGWASGKTFRVGDILTFDFTTARHTVQSVTKASYDNCVTDSNDGQIISTGPANVTLSSTGIKYFICTVAGHCTAGQKLEINVSGSNTTTSSPPRAATAPSPASGRTPPAAGDSPTAPSTETSQPPAAALTPPSSSPALLAGACFSLGSVFATLVLL